LSYICLTNQINKMKNLTKGQKVKNQYGVTLTVVEQIENMVRVVEDYNNLYHVTKLATK